jgi:hypothetical protein
MGKQGGQIWSQNVARNASRAADGRHEFGRDLLPNLNVLPGQINKRASSDLLPATVTAR